MIVVANLYGLAQVEGKFSLEHKILERRTAKIQDRTVKTANDNYLVSGIYYEVLEKETNKWHSDKTGIKLPKSEPKAEPKEEVKEVEKKEIKKLNLKKK